jgi:hypothetical protein
VLPKPLPTFGRHAQKASVMDAFLFILTLHVVLPKPLPTFGRHAQKAPMSGTLSFCIILISVHAADAKIDHFDQRIFLRCGLQRCQGITGNFTEMPRTLHRIGNRAVLCHQANGLFK